MWLPLFERSIYLAAAHYPWLAPLKPGHIDPAVLMGELTAAFSAQQPAAVMEAGTAAFASFRELLTTLIGERLCERLLQAALWSASSATAAQDPKP